MDNRLFVFGCSLTKYTYPTWADIISANYDEYHNYGRPGGSNTLIMNRVIEANEKFKFDPTTDTVVIMMTGIGRFSYVDPKSNYWQCTGEIMNHAYSQDKKHLINFVENMWSEKMAVYMSWIAIKTIKFILTTLSIPHTILMGIPFDAYLKTNEFLDEDSIKLVNEIYSLIDTKHPLQQWSDFESHKFKNPDEGTVIWKLENRPDGHPSVKMHYEYIKTFRPEWVNSKTDSRFAYFESNLSYESPAACQTIFNNIFRTEFDYSERNKLFGDTYMIAKN